MHGTGGTIKLPWGLSREATSPQIKLIMMYCKPWVWKNLSVQQELGGGETPVVKNPGTIEFTPAERAKCSVVLWESVKGAHLNRKRKFLFPAMFFFPQNPLLTKLNLMPTGRRKVLYHLDSFIQSKQWKVNLELGNNKLMTRMPVNVIQQFHFQVFI